MLQTFDAPNGDFSCVRRARSNTPLQALTTLNEPIFLECARALALRTLQEGGGYRRRAAHLRLPPLPGRTPTEREATVAARPARPAGRAVRARRGQALGTRRGRSEQAAHAARGRDARPACRLDRGVARAAEPRRDDHQGIRGSSHELPGPSLPQRESDAGRSPLVPPAVRRRPRFAGARPAPEPGGYAAPASATATRWGSIRSPPRRRTCAQGQARHLPVHGRRAEPPRTLRQQAPAREVRRHAASARVAQGVSRGVHQPEFEAARPEVQVRPARPERRRALGAAARTWRRSSTTSRSCGR